MEPRILCADLIDMHWKDKTGRTRKNVVNLEDISLSGACVQCEDPVPLQTPVRIRHPKGEFSGIVRYCVFRDIGYFLGVEFEPGSKWSARDFKPLHMLDPRQLVMRAVNRVREESRRPQ